MSYPKRLLLLLTLAFAISGSTQEMPEGRMMRFPDIYKDKIVFMYGGDLWLASTPEETPGASPPTPAANSSQNSRPTVNGSPSPDNTTATSTCT